MRASQLRSFKIEDGLIAHPKSDQAFVSRYEDLEEDLDLMQFNGAKMIYIKKFKSLLPEKLKEASKLEQREVMAICGGIFSQCLMVDKKGCVFQPFCEDFVAIDASNKVQVLALTILRPEKDPSKRVAFRNDVKNLLLKVLQEANKGNLDYSPLIREVESRSREFEGRLDGVNIKQILDLKASARSTSKVESTKESTSHLTEKERESLKQKDSEIFSEKDRKNSFVLKSFLDKVDLSCDKFAIF